MNDDSSIYDRLLSADEFFRLAAQSPTHTHSCKRCGFLIEVCDCGNRDFRPWCLYCQEKMQRQIRVRCQYQTRQGRCRKYSGNGEELYCERHLVPRDMAPV